MQTDSREPRTDDKTFEAQDESVDAKSTLMKTYENTGCQSGEIQREAVRRYREGWRVIPLLPGDKRPAESSWQNTEYDSEAEVREAFPVTDPERNVATPNLGVVLGRKSRLVCVDLDAADPRIAALALPATDLVDGRPGSPESHWFYRIPGGNDQTKLGKKQFSGKLADRPLVEVLADGQQAALPPSYYEEIKETRAWARDGVAAEVEYDDLVAAAGRAAAFSEIALLWPKLDGVRHDASLPLIGGLVRAGIEPDTIEALLALAWPSQDPGEARNAVASTVAKQEADEPFTGWKVFREMCGPGLKKSVDQIISWLGTSSDERPKVLVNSGEVAVIADRAWAALEKANDPPKLFQQNGKIVRVNPIQVRGSGNSKTVQPGIEPLTRDSLQGELSRELAWVKPSDEGFTLTSPTPAVLRVMHSERSDRMPLPVISRVVSHPIYGADGSLRTEPGYHEGSQTYLWPGEELTLEPIPEAPTPDDVAEAKRLLFDELLYDFPFDGEASRANALAMGLLPYGREFIDGPTPLHFIEAPKQGSGKDLLARSYSVVWNGPREVASMPYTPEEEEWRKVTIAHARAGSSVFYIANIKGFFESAVLERAITHMEITGRVLGTSDNFDGELRVHWLGTGNNAVVSPDLGRRICPIRLDAQIADPYTRTGFKHTLPGWALEHRAELTWALLTLWQNWLAQGRPKGNYVLGSFESWAEVMGGVLDAAGVTGFLDNVREFQDEAVDEETEWQEFVSLWLLTYGTKRVKPSELVQVAENVDGFDFGKANNPAGRAMNLSRQLKIKRGTRWHEYREEGKVPDALTIQVGKNSRTGRFEYWLEHTDKQERKPALGGLTVLSGGGGFTGKTNPR